MSKILQIQINRSKYRKSQKQNKSIKFIKVLCEIVYIDKKNKTWIVPKGFESDGVSSRLVTQWVSGEPLEGDTLLAALVHDVYCESQERSQKETHQVFREILKEDGVNILTRNVMYQAVTKYNRFKNPNWK